LPMASGVQARTSKGVNSQAISTFYAKSTVSLHH
jgi:hypothetical protein